MPFAYDEIPYISRPYLRTHPSRLATLATLYGMSPPPVDRCRVLELGCADGGNVIPMALTLPGSEFVGVDLAQQPVAAGREVIGHLGLKNIELRAADITQVDTTWGEFDYIIAHGVYAWVPAAVRDAIMRIAAQNLAAQGVAFVSYNTHPGGYLRRMFREMMLHHVSGVEDGRARVAKARDLMAFLDASVDSMDSNLRAMWRREIAEILDRPPNVLFHDELSADWDPVFFHEFMAHAQKRRLQFLAEADYSDMAEAKLRPDVVAGLTALSAGDRLAREQYRDFVVCRKFRRTLLCHREVPLETKVEAGRVRKLFATSTAREAPVSAEEKAAGIHAFCGQSGAHMKTAHPLVVALITRLMEAAPRPLHFEELIAELGGKNADAIGEVLLSMYATELVELAAWRPAIVLVAGELPEASALARLQASHSSRLTTLLHSSVQTEDERVRRLVTLLDGTRDRAALQRKLFDSEPNGENSRAQAEELERNLEIVARLGLLVS